MNQRTDALVTAGIFLAALLFLLAFRRLGWFMQDEGVLYYQYLRTLQGQVPYHDFYTGYPPLVYYLHAWIFSHFEISIGMIRIAMAFVNALSAAALYAVSRRVAPRAAALVPPVLFLVMQPGDITDMAFHNSPYPSWYAVAFAVLGTWATLRALETPPEVPREAGAGKNLSIEARRAGWLLAAGFLGGLTFLAKQNAGIFFLWGVTGLLASRPDPPRGSDDREPPIARLARIAYLALIPISALFLIKNFLNPATIALFVIPPATLALIGARARFGRRASAALPARLLWVAAGFAIAFAPWLAFFAGKVGLGAFLKGLFFVGSDIDRNLYIPFPPPDLATIALLLPLATWGLVARFTIKERGPRLRALAATLFAFVLGAMFAQSALLAHLARRDYGLGQIHTAVSMALDNIAAYGTFLLLAAALLVAWRQARGRAYPEDPPAGPYLCVLWIAACSFLLYYPRMDAAHLVSAAPLLYVVGAALLGRARTGVESVVVEGKQPFARRAFHAIAALALAFVVLVKIAPKLYSRMMLARTPAGIRIVETPKERLGLERADLYFPIYLEAHRPPIVAFRDLVNYLTAATRPRDAIFAFPALPMVYFVSGRDNRTQQDFFFGNNVNFQEQLDVIRTLERERVPTVVIANNPNDYFVAKGRDFTRVIWAYLRSRYYLERRIGPYDVLRRYGAPRGGSDAPEKRRTGGPSRSEGRLKSQR